MFSLSIESDDKHCPTCGMGICPGPDATPEQRAAAIEEQSREWAQKDIPQDEWDRWNREFVAAQIRCAAEKPRRALKRAIDTIDTQCDSEQLVAELRAELEG